MSTQPLPNNSVSIFSEVNKKRTIRTQSMKKPVEDLLKKKQVVKKDESCRVERSEK